MQNNKSFLRRAISLRQECIDQLRSLCSKKEIHLWKYPTEEMLDRETFDEDKHNEKLSKLPTGMTFLKHGNTLYWAITGVRVKDGQLEFHFVDDIDDSFEKPFWVNIDLRSNANISIDNLAKLVDMVQNKRKIK